MKKPVFAVARVVAMDWTAWLMARTADTPTVFVLANSSDPKWYIATAGAMTEFGSPAMPAARGELLALLPAEVGPHPVQMEPVRHPHPARFKFEATEVENMASSQMGIRASG